LDLNRLAKRRRVTLSWICAPQKNNTQNNTFGSKRQPSLPVYLCALTMTHFYEIRIAGHLDAHWADWFDGMSITLEEDGATLLSGPVPDQPALYGLLRKVRDLDFHSFR